MSLIRPLLCSLLLFAGSVNAANVTEIVPPQVPAKTAIDVASRKLTRTVDFSAWKVNIDPIDIIGTSHPGVFCSSAEEDHYWTKLGDWMQGATRDAYVKESSKLGYPKRQDVESAFEQKLGSDADFKVGVTLLEFKFSECGLQKDLSGSVYVKMKWELFSVLRQKVVFSKTIDASYSNVNGAGMSAEDLYKKLLMAEVDNLLADPDFASTIESGGSNSVQSNQPLLKLTSSVSAKVDVAKASASLQSAVVTIESGLGSGSGFFVSDDGYLLTNEHVVGGAKFVKLKTLEGKSMIGQVVRIDSVRDVALIKTESSGMSVLAVRKSNPTVGENVYAIGSPYGEKLAGTLTQGVLSSRRTLEGVTYLQSDASISPGNSGGPLIDASGAVIGIAQLSVGKSGGINLFIPVDEALEKLNLTLN